MLRTCFCAVLLLASACQSARPPSPTNLADAMVGRWAMETVYQDGQDVTAEHDPSDNRWMQFDGDGTFVSDGDPHGRNTGRWTLDPDTRELHIDSDAGDDDDSYWIVEVDGDTMRWTGARFDWNKRFELLHRRE